MATANRTCSIAGCDRTQSARGYCLPCYKRLRRSGDLERVAVVQECTVQDCHKPHKAKGLCSTHYVAFLYRRAGTCSITSCEGHALVSGLCHAHHFERRRAEGDICTLEGCEDARFSAAYCRRHYRQAANGKIPMVEVQCSRCGSDIPLSRSERSGRTRPVHTKTCDACKGWRRTGAPELSVEQIIERDGSDCGICGQPIDASISWPNHMSPSVDHVVPGSLGGSHEAANLVAAHLVCNLKKGARIPESI